MAYWKFDNFLIKCQGLTDGRNWNLFNSPDLLCILILKLLMTNGRWNRRVQFTWKNQPREPGFADFIKFIDKELELVNDPLWSWEAVDQHTKRKDRERESLTKMDRQFKVLLTILLEGGSQEKDCNKDINYIVTYVTCTKTVAYPEFFWEDWYTYKTHEGATMEKFVTRYYKNALPGSVYSEIFL